VVKRGLPTEIKMRHDAHYVEEFVKTHRSIGKILPINQIEPNPDQPRVEIGDLTELTSSIKQKGVLEPLLVKPVRETGNWMIIAGERRWRAANLAGLKEVPCIELDIDDKAVAEIALIENLQRKDLTVWEEADGLAALAETYGYTHEEIAKKIAKSRTTVTESMAIAGIPEEIRQKCRTANISAKSTLLEIARQFDDAAMHQFVENITSNSLKREEVRNTARPQTKNAERKEFKAEKTAPETTFRYVSNDNGFRLEVRFLEKADFGKKDILQALKEAFDTVKANQQ
jgi:ParB family transcriptional regulator, chromosome partitioning protein